ncbi:MAG: hypothetical protein ACFE9R_02950 [Candidatus Hermodarchaeota archaeon]
MIVFFNNQLYGIWSAGIFLFGYFIFFSISVSSKKRLIKTIRGNLLISDEEIAKKLKRSVEDIRKTMFSLSRNQKHKKWLIAYLNNRYIFLNEEAVELFNQLYSRGYNEKQIFENLQRRMTIRSRAEVKAIETTLATNKRLNNKVERD